MTTPSAYSSSAANESRAGIRAAQVGVGINLVLALVKIGAGIAGHTYALIADGVESLADVAASLVVWGGIAVGARPPDEDHPYGHGKAEALAAATVSLMLVAASIGIATEAVREIRTPHEFPASWTLVVLLSVVAIKAILARRVATVGRESNSSAVAADARHHLSDAITSAAAFVGISAALLGRRFGGGPSWASADDWAAIVAALVIGWNGLSMFLVGLHDLMDRSPGEEVLGPLREVATSMPGVLAVEKLIARRVGNGYRVTIHVQADPHLTLAEGHALGGRVKYALMSSGRRVHAVNVHMEPYENAAQ